MMQKTAAMALASLATFTLTSHNVGAADLKAPAGVDVTWEAHSRRFYVRGDVGVARNTSATFSQQDLADNGGTFLSQSMGDTVLIGAGFGWQFNNRFRIDLTGEYRSKTTIKALDNITAATVDPPGVLQANTLYQGNVSSYVGLINGYFDIVKWRGFTPYVGAGVGIASTSLTGLTTISSASLTDDATGAQILQVTHGYAADRTKTGLAWALMAGTSYDLSPNSKLDLGYRYLNLGSDIAASNLINCACGTEGSPLKIADVDAHEFRLGIRWLLGEPAAPVYVPMK